jgi:Chorion family 3.
MDDKIGKIFFLLVFLSLGCAGPATAAINTISQGNAVFIGESGLDISAAMGPDIWIGWWASAADITTTSPTNKIDLTGRISSFTVNPSEFEGYLGNWYRLNGAGKADGSAFNVVDPQIVIKAEDVNVDVDPALQWIPSGDDIRFRIDTNIGQIASQRSAAPPITIKVQSPSGAIYSSLSNAAGTRTSIVDIPVNAVIFYTGPIWNMGNPDVYPQGNYTIWAESNVNHMNDNYDVIGKTISNKVTLLNQGKNPLIGTTTPTSQITTQNTVLPTQTTSKTQQPTSVTTMTTTPIPTTATTPPTPYQTQPSQTQAPGFEATLASAAILFGLVFFIKKE